MCRSSIGVSIGVVDERGHEYGVSDGQIVQVAGSLAQKKTRAGAPLQGVLVQQGGRHTVVAAQDLPAYTSLHPGRILQRQILSLRKPFSEVRLHLIVSHLRNTEDLARQQSRAMIDAPATFVL